jgi:hypothetical protein
MPTMISDPIEFELFKNSLFSIADEMALRLSRSPITAPNGWGPTHPAPCCL